MFVANDLVKQLKLNRQNTQCTPILLKVLYSFKRENLVFKNQINFYIKCLFD